VEMASAEPDLWKRGQAYRMPSERVDGQDVLAVREATQRLLRLAREERQPALLECLTYRYRGHSVADPGKSYRPQEEIERWRARDPIVLFEQTLRTRGILDDAAVEAVRAEVEAEVTSISMTQRVHPTSTGWVRVRRSASSASAAPIGQAETPEKHVHGPGLPHSH
ncbi:MAG: hypothetical protein EBT47_08870, partial [Chloroflexi bacterium]|nr:hypothetical protein [Chloroflexota bacterium]